MPKSVLWLYTINIDGAPITQYMHMRNKNSNTQGSSSNVGKSDFPYLKELLLKERICSLWNQILSLIEKFPFLKGM